MTWLRARVGSAFVPGCGPIAAPPGAVDLAADPHALDAAFDSDVAWDVWVLFARDATSASADEHVIGWGSTGVATEAELFAQL